MTCFSFLRVTACHSSLFPPTNDNLDQDWSKFWQMNVDGKNAASRNLFIKNWNLLSFFVFYYSCFSTAAPERIQLLKKIPWYYCVLFIWVLANESVSAMAVFVRTFMHAITAEWRRKLKAFLTWVTTSFQELHLRWVWVIAFFCRVS